MIVHAITPKEIVHAVTPKLIVHAIAPRLIVDAVIPKSKGHVIVTLETPTATSLSVAPVSMPKPSHVVTPEWTPKSVPTLSLDDKEPVKSSDAEVAMSPPPRSTIDEDARGSDTHAVTPESTPHCVKLFGAQAGPSLLLPSLLLRCASRCATRVASLLLRPSPSAEVHIG